MANSVLVLVTLVLGNSLGAAQSPPLGGEDLHIAAPWMAACKSCAEGWDEVILLNEGVSLQIGDNEFSSRSAVVWLKAQGKEQQGFGTGISYLARVYLEESVSVRQGQKAKATPMAHFDVTGAEALLAEFKVTGEVFASADQKLQIEQQFLTDYEFYTRANEAAKDIPSGPVLRAESLVPEPARAIARPSEMPGEVPAIAPEVAEKLNPTEAADEKKQEPVQEYPVQLSAVWEPVPMIERVNLPDGTQVITAAGRFYIWQKRTEEQMIEFMADKLVMFIDPNEFDLKTADKGSQLGAGQVRSVYLAGNIVMTEGPRTTRADEIYYDFINSRALVVNASLRMYDEERGIPIYLRAKKIGRVSDDIFEAEDITLTNSEFYFPQLSVTASKMVVLTGEALQQQQRLSDKADPQQKIEGKLYDIRAKAGDTTLFKWDKLTTDFGSPNLPISRLSVGNDSRFGTSLETSWYLFKLLGMEEPDWLESRVLADYYSERGPGGGVEAEYEKGDTRGSLIGYVLKDKGEDDLGRTDDRRNLEPENDLRGRFSWRHQQLLPDDWQLTTEVSYITDRNFLELMYRNEFWADKEQETLVYLKKIKDNWGFSVLTKFRINDFEDTTEELPSIEYHRTGQSFWDDTFTWYSDTQVARMRNRFDEDSPREFQETSDFYTFASTRNEVDLPLQWETFKFVPFTAASYAYEDNYGYQFDLNGDRISGEDQVVLGEAGVRGSTMFWKEDPYVRSELFDLKGIRHIMTPYFETVNYSANDSSADMRDAAHVGLLQRWQTHRGSESNVRTLDWIRLDTEATWVKDDAESSIGPAFTYGPAAFVYNDPSIPILLRRNESFYGMVRDTINNEFIWRLSDTMSLLSDMNYDMNSGQVQQLDVGVARYVYPDMSYYLGSRYLRPVLVQVDENGDGILDVDEEGSHAVIAAVTYRISPRYMASFSQEYNFDFGKSVRSDLALIRQYHRLFYSLSFSIDQSLKDNAVMLSIWPQGVDELALGSRKYTGMTGRPIED